MIRRRPTPSTALLRSQYIMKAIAASDGTRKGVRDAAFSGKITIPAEQSVIGKEFSIDAKRRRDRAATCRSSS